MIEPDRECWSVDSSEGSVTVLRYTKSGRTQGFVSICEKQRNWELGCARYVRPRSFCGAPSQKYQGRGWQGRLALDAMLAVEEIYKDEK